MKKKNQTLFLVCLLVINMVLSSGVYGIGTPASYNVTIDPTIHLQISNQQFIARDVNGNAMFPILLNGSTYLPLRGVAAATGLDVKWDGATQTAYLTTPSGGTASGSNTFVKPQVEIEGAVLTPVNEREDNDDRYTPQVIELQTVVSGVIDDLEGSVQDGDDFYEVSVPSEGILWVQTLSTYSCNPEVYILGNESTSIVASDANDIKPIRTIEIPVEKGTYLINIKNADAQGTYELKVGCLPIVVETESNDQRETAYGLKENGMTYGWIDAERADGKKDTSDLYRFTLSASQYVCINTVNEEWTNVELYLYASTKTTAIASDTSGIKSNRYIKTNLQAGTYYIEVKNADETGYYGIKYETVQPEKAVTSQVVAKVNQEIKIMIDGQVFIAKDANGNGVYPVTIAGSTYLPVRAVAQAVNMYVGWDKSTRTVLLDRVAPDNEPVLVTEKYADSGTVSESEDNDDRYTANVIGLIQTVTGIIGDKQSNKTDDDDFFEVSLPYAGELQITLDNDINTNCELYVMGKKSTQILYEDKTGITSGRSVIAHLKAGDYLIKIGNSDSEGAYTLTTNYIPRSVQVENNDIRKESCAIDIGKSYVGFTREMDAYGNVDTSDFYKLYLFDSGTLSIDVTADSYVNPEIYLYSASGSSSVMEDGAGIHSSRKITLTVTPGVYYIQIKNADHEGEYTLTTQLEK